MTFSGSYPKSLVEILMNPIDMESTPVDEREELIQKHGMHYSDFFTREKLPSKEYMKLFSDCMKSESLTKMANDCYSLAEHICNIRPNDITIVSLARAGTPVGCIVKLIIEELFNRKCDHYSVSIIRDRGIDTVALDYITEKHSPESIVYVDGWVGKGTISRELTKYSQQYNPQIDSGLYCLCDLSGWSAYAPSNDDYLIPSSIMNATLSGLVSRSIYPKNDGFHCCYYYEEFLKEDLSLSFVMNVMNHVKLLKNKDLKEESMKLIQTLTKKYNVMDENYIKPGIGEATRVLMRRVPDVLIVRNYDDPEVQHLLTLAMEKNVTTHTMRTLPYKAVAIIKSLD